jgi:serine/threonine-protein kinase
LPRPSIESFPVIPGFTIEAEIGRGTSARVYRARQEKLNRPVALKVIATLGEDGNRRALRLFREASLTGALDHPGIVRAIDAGDLGDLCWFAMELVEGRTLQQILDESGPMPWRKAITLALEVLAALDHAHLRGVVHRDLKPSNILVDTQGHARVLDLGLARREADPRLTHEGGTVGTPRFMAPEQALNPVKVDGRADLFALGAVLYRSISGIAPFDGETVAAVLTRLLYDDPAPLSMLQPDIPEAVSLVIGKVLEKDPEHRFRDAASFASALREAARGQRPQAVRVPGRWLWIVLGTMGALVAGALAYMAFGSRVEPRPQEPSKVETPPPARGPARVRELVPPARPNLAALDRARMALELADKDSSPDVSKDLAAALEPLRSDLKLAAAQHRAAVRGVLLTSGIGPARQKMGLIGDRLRADVLGEGEEDLHPGLEAMVVEIGRAATEAFEAEIATEQRDAASDVQRKLDDLLSRPDAERWTRTEQLDAVERTLKEGGILSLEGEDRAAVLRKRDEVLSRLATLPQKRTERQLGIARALIREGKFRQARLNLAELGVTGAPGTEPLSAVEARPLLDAIDAGENKLVAEAEALVEKIGRGPAPALDSAGRKRRASDLETNLAILRASVDEVPQMREPVAFAGLVSKIATEAASLRDRVLERLGAGSSSPIQVDWKLRRRGSVGVRSVIGREGLRIVVRKEDGTQESFDSEDVSAQGIADLDRLLGGSTIPVVVALLEFWDGDDDAARQRLLGLPGDPVRDTLLGMVGAAIEAAASSYPTEAEREAFPVFLQARRLFAEGSYARALELAEGMLAQKRLTGTALLRQHGEEIGSIATRSRSVLLRSARMRPFGSAAELKDERAGLVRLSWVFDEKEPEGLGLPPGRLLMPDGLHWPGRPGDRAGLPEQSPALRLAFAEGTLGAPATIEVDLRRSREPVPFICLSFGGYTLLALGDLRQANAFAGHALHGLERDLVQFQAVHKAVLIAGTAADARRALPVLGRAAPLNRGESTLVRLKIDLAHGEVSATVGGEQIPLSGDRRPPAEGPALDLRLPPGVVVRSLSIELPLVPKQTQ